MELVWSDRGGKRLQSISVPADYPENSSLSPQGTRLAGRRVDPEIATGDIWLLEFSRGTLSRFTDDPSYEYFPIWSPDGDRIVFSSVREGHADLHVKLLNSSGDSQPLLKSNTAKYPQDWSFDGRFILYSNFDPQTNQLDLWVLPLFGDRQPEPFLKTPFEEKQAQFSPDGRWVAYCSDESGKDEVYVQSFPVPGNKALISVGGGRRPRWRRDGKELFYLSDDGRIMVLDIKAGSTLTASIPRALPLRGPLRGEPDLGTYSVAADGQRFLIPTGKQSATAEVINIVLNWTADLRKQR
jgi:Tol biopolymer transport system component